MRHPSFVVLACVWLALCGLALLRPAYGEELREAEGEGPVVVAQHPEPAPTTQAWLQVALLALSPTACDEEILAAAELPLGSGQPTRCTLRWSRRAADLEFGLLGKLVAKHAPRDPTDFCIVERQRELGMEFPWENGSATVLATPQPTADGVRLVRASFAGSRGGRRTWGGYRDSWCEPGVDSLAQQLRRDLDLSFDRPQLLLHDETGFAVMLRATRTPTGREPLERCATWRQFFASWLAPAVATEPDVVAEQSALAGLVLRDVPLLVAARSAPMPPPLADDAGGWRRFARRALAIARGSLGADGALDPFGCEPVLAVRSLRTGPASLFDAEFGQALVASLHAEMRDVPLAGLLAADGTPEAPALAALRDAAIVAATPSWMRRVPWFLPTLLVFAAVGLWLFVQRPQVGVVRPVGLGGMLLLALTMLVQCGPFDTWARAVLLVLLCLPRWGAMDRLWRLVAGLALFVTAVGVAQPFELLPLSAPWSNLALLTTAGTWLLALGVVLGDPRWRAPQLLAAVVALLVAPIAALLVPGLAAVALFFVKFGAAYAIAVMVLLLLFFCTWRRQPGHAGRLDEPPLAAAQPA